MVQVVVDCPGVELRADTPLGNYVVKVSAAFLLCVFLTLKLSGTSSIEAVQAGITGYWCPLITHAGEECPAWNNAPQRTLWHLVKETLAILIR